MCNPSQFSVCLLENDLADSMHGSQYWNIRKVADTLVKIAPGSWTIKRLYKKDLKQSDPLAMCKALRTYDAVVVLVDTSSTVSMNRMCWSGKTYMDEIKKLHNTVF
jgi:hypothetical protein